MKAIVVCAQNVSYRPDSVGERKYAVNRKMLTPWKTADSVQPQNTRMLKCLFVMPS